MSTRKRIIYQSQAVSCKTVFDAAAQNYMGVQSVSYGLDIAREDVNQFGDLGAVDRVVLEAPTANAEVNLYVNGCTAAHLSGLLRSALESSGIDLKIGLNPDEGIDYVSGSSSSIQLASGSLASLSAEASVGSIATLTLGFEGTNINHLASTAPEPPATNISIATQTGVQLNMANFNAAGPSVSGFTTHAQSVSVNFDLGLEGLQQLGATSNAGERYVYARVPSFPASASMTVENLAVTKGFALDLNNVKQSAAEGGSNADTGGQVDVAVAMGATNFKLVKATLDSVSFNNAIGDNATASCTLSCSIGSPTSPSRLEIS